MEQPQMKIWQGSTILKPLLIRVKNPKTLHKTVVLVTFSGKCDKNLSQKVILWQTLWQNLLKAKKSNHNREITNIVVFNFEESRIQLVWDFCLKLQVRYNLLNIRLLFPDAGNSTISYYIVNQRYNKNTISSLSPKCPHNFSAFKKFHLFSSPRGQMKKGATKHCSRAASGVNNRSLASDRT